MVVEVILEVMVVTVVTISSTDVRLTVLSGHAWRLFR